jgi:hypothetical protein
MKVFNLNIEGWWSMLKHLSKEMKLELASRLIESLKKPELPNKQHDDSWMKLYGSWEDENQTTEELIDFIRNSRINNRQIESLD